MDKVDGRKARFTDITGQRFGQRVVLGLYERGVKNDSKWLVKCDCGREDIVYGNPLKHGRANRCISCSNFIGKQRKMPHGHATKGKRSGIYTTWTAMIARCKNEKHPAFKYYGKLGVKVCERWLDFKNFLDDMGEKWWPGATIDRDDPSGNYEPCNCRWLSKIDNVRRKKRKTLERGGIY
jgi:hypothetical protein